MFLPRFLVAASQYSRVLCTRQPLVLDFSQYLICCYSGLQCPQNGSRLFDLNGTGNNTLPCIDAALTSGSIKFIFKLVQ